MGRRGFDGFDGVIVRGGIVKLYVSFFFFLEKRRELNKELW